MAILETLARSRRLCEKRSVVILMYPPHLKSGSNYDKLMLYHGSTEKPPNTCSVNDYAVRHGFAKQRNRMLQPLLFLTASHLLLQHMPFQRFIEHNYVRFLQISSIAQRS